MGKILQFPESEYPVVPQEEIDALFAADPGSERFSRAPGGVRRAVKQDRPEPPDDRTGTRRGRASVRYRPVLRLRQNR